MKNRTALSPPDVQQARSIVLCFRIVSVSSPVFGFVHSLLYVDQYQCCVFHNNFGNRTSMLFLKCPENFSDPDKMMIIVLSIEPCKVHGCHPDFQPRMRG